MSDDDMSDGERMIDTQAGSRDGAEHALRPTSLDEFVGQQKVRENLGVFIQAARDRGD